MPTVLRQNGFRYFMWANDHRPPHVHVEYAGDLAVIEIETLAVRANPTMRTPDIARAAAVVLENRELLLNKWRQFHA